LECFDDRKRTTRSRIWTLVHPRRCADVHGRGGQGRAEEHNPPGRPKAQPRAVGHHRTERGRQARPDAVAAKASPAGRPKEQGRAAADAGTDIHASIQGFYDGDPNFKHHAHVMGCTKVINNHFGLQGWVAERAFAHEMGFGGKCDLHAPARLEFKGVVVDVKTKDFSDPEKVEGYDDHLMQLAAYRVGLGIPKARCANVFVSRSVAGLSVMREWSAEDLDRGWLMFTHLLSFWQLKNQHQ
jgi:hypothetical protein